MTQDVLPTEIYNPQLPLAVYYEAAAHLRQVAGVQVELLPPRSLQFDYDLSQIGGLRIRFMPEANQISQQQVQQILAYYGDRFSQWQLLV
jgi:hypothetical protein